MFKALSRKLLGEKYSGALKGLFVAAIIGFSLRELETVIPLSGNVLMLTVMIFSGTVVIQVMGSADNARYLKGYFAMPFSSFRTAAEYAAAVGAYTLFTKTSLVAGLLLAFTEMTALRWVLFAVSFIYACLGGMAAFAYFRDKPYISAVLAGGGIAMCLLLKESWLAVGVFAAASIAAGLLLAFTSGYRFIAGTGTVKLRRKTKSAVPAAAQILRYLSANRSFLFGLLMIIAFATYMAVTMYGMEMKFAAGMGLALISVNSPAAVAVSSDRGLSRKLDALPGKARYFFLPYGVVLFCLYSLCFAVYLTAASLAGLPVGAAEIVMAAVFAAEGAFLTAFLEYRFPLKNWSVESDLWHNPRKYILPCLLFAEAAAVGLLLGK